MTTRTGSSMMRRACSNTAGSRRLPPPIESARWTDWCIIHSRWPVLVPINTRYKGVVDAAGHLLPGHRAHGRRGHNRGPGRCPDTRGPSDAESTLLDRLDPGAACRGSLSGAALSGADCTPPSATSLASGSPLCRPAWDGCSSPRQEDAGLGGGSAHCPGRGRRRPHRKHRHHLPGACCGRRGGRHRSRLCSRRLLRRPRDWWRPCPMAPMRL